MLGSSGDAHLSAGTCCYCCSAQAVHTHADGTLVPEKVFVTVLSILVAFAIGSIPTPISIAFHMEINPDGEDYNSPLLQAQFCALILDAISRVFQTMVLISSLPSATCLNRFE